MWWNGEGTGWGWNTHQIMSRERGRGGCPVAAGSFIETVGESLSHSWPSEDTMPTRCRSALSIPAARGQLPLLGAAPREQSLSPMWAQMLDHSSWGPLTNYAPCSPRLVRNVLMFSTARNIDWINDPDNKSSGIPGGPELGNTGPTNTYDILSSRVHTMYSHKQVNQCSN